jgi:hypothetical protein
MEILAALVPLLLMLMERHLATAPAREREQREAEYERDLAALNRALAEGDHETVTRLFELSRKAARRRGVRDAGAAEPTGELPAGPDGLGDPGRSDG